MEIKFDSKLIIAVLIVLLIVIYSIASVDQKNNQIESIRKDFLKSEGFYENEKLKLNEAISELDENNKTLKEKLNNIKNNTQVEYIVETKYITNTIVKTLDYLPNEYIYFDSNDIPICKFEFISKKPIFTSLNVDYTLSTIIEKDYSYSILNIKDYKGNIHEILMGKSKLETKVIKIKPKKKLINPKLSLGVSVNYSNKINLEPILTLNVIELNPKLNIISPSILLESKAIGASIVDYNIGSEDKILSDTWIGFGIYTNIEKTYYSINLSSRF